MITIKIVTGNDQSYSFLEEEAHHIQEDIYAFSTEQRACQTLSRLVLQDIKQQVLKESHYPEEKIQILLPFPSPKDSMFLEVIEKKLHGFFQEQKQMTSIERKIQQWVYPHEGFVQFYLRKETQEIKHMIQELNEVLQKRSNTDEEEEQKTKEDLGFLKERFLENPVRYHHLDVKLEPHRYLVIEKETKQIIYEDVQMDEDQLLIFLVMNRSETLHVYEKNHKMQKYSVILITGLYAHHVTYFSQQLM